MFYVCSFSILIPFCCWQKDIDEVDVTLINGLIWVDLGYVYVLSLTGEMGRINFFS